MAITTFVLKDRLENNVKFTANIIHEDYEDRVSERLIKGTNALVFPEDPHISQIVDPGIFPTFRKLNITGLPNIIIKPVFSTNSMSVSIRYIFYDELENIIGYSTTKNITCTGIELDDGTFLGETLYISNMGFSYLEIEILEIVSSGTVSFFINENLPLIPVSGPYVLCVSLYGGNEIRPSLKVNFGTSFFYYPVEGYTSIGGSFDSETKGIGIILSDRTITISDLDAWLSCKSTYSFGGKSLVELIYSGPGNDTIIGMGNSNVDLTHIVGYDANSFGFKNSASSVSIHDNTAASYGHQFVDGDIIGLAVNAIDDIITFYINGVSQGDISIEG